VGDRHYKLFGSSREVCTYTFSQNFIHNFFFGNIIAIQSYKKKEKKKKKDITSYDNLRVVCIYIFFPKFYENPAGGINPKPPPLNQKEN
jgi:hypothetical protein